MKKLLCILLVILMVTPALAFAEIEGVTVDEFQTYLLEGATKSFNYKKTPVVQPDFETIANNQRTVLNGLIASANFSVVSFEDTDMIEYAMIYLPIGLSDNNATVYLMSFLLSIVDNAKVTKREENAMALLDGLESSVSIDKNNEVYAAANNDNYFTYSFDDNGASVYMHLHQSSEIEYEDLRQIAEDTLIAASAYTQSDTDVSSDDAVTLSSGEYDCPAHIAAGEYKVTPTKSATLTVYRNGDLKTVEYLSTTDEDEIGRLVLQSGDKLEISGGKLVFEPLQ